MDKEEYAEEIPVVTVYHWEYNNETKCVRVVLLTKREGFLLDAQESALFMHIDNNTPVKDIIGDSGIEEERALLILKDFENTDIISYRSRAPLIWVDESDAVTAESEAGAADILLVNPPLSGVYGGRLMEEEAAAFPPGILCLINWLVLHGYRVEAVDLASHRIKKSEFLALLERVHPRIVGISVVTEKYIPAIELARTVKGWNPETVVICGGPHVSVLDEPPLQTGAVDIVVRGEGEMTLLELAEQLLRNRGRPLHLIAGITYSADGNIHRTPDRPFLRTLDALPFPVLNLKNIEHDKDSAILISSRGCPGKCVFCAARYLSGRAYRARSAEHVVAEMRYLYHVLGYKMIGVSDDTMVSLPKRITKICQYLIDAHFDGLWSADSRVDTVSPELLSLMAKAGCFFIHYGMESGDQGVLDAIRKEITVEQICNAVKWTYDAGIFVKISVMVGHHADTKESIEKTLECIADLAQYNVVVTPSINTPYPGTYLYEHADELGVTILSRTWEDYTLLAPVIETQHLSKIEIQNLYHTVRNASMRTWKHINTWREKARSLSQGG